MNEEFEKQYLQMSALSDRDVLLVYGISAKILSDRDQLALCKKELTRIIKSQKRARATCVFKTPPVFKDRGKTRRLAGDSILLEFLKEDWGYLFTGNYDNDRKYYVYYHSNPEKGNARFKRKGEFIDFNGRPFYVGKGTGNRYKSKTRSRSHLAVINKVIESGKEDKDIFHIFKDGLAEVEALELEAKLITFFGVAAELDQSKTHFHGTKGGWLVNSDPACRPEDVSRMMRIKG